MGFRTRSATRGEAVSFLLLILLAGTVDLARAALKVGPTTCSACNSPNINPNLACPAPGCTPIAFAPYRDELPLTTAHRPKIGNTVRNMDTVVLQGPNSIVPIISLCKGPKNPTDLRLGTDAAGKPVYAAPNSLLMYSWDNPEGVEMACRNPTYPGPALVATQYGGAQQFTFKNRVSGLHPLDFAVDPRLYAEQAAVLPGVVINYVPGQATQSTVPAVVHVHGIVGPVKFDGTPASTLTTNYGADQGGTRTDTNTLDHNFTDISNPPAMLLYHDHAYGFTRLNVYAGAAGVMLVKEGTDARLTGQPKPTHTCPPAQGPGPCNLPELGSTDSGSFRDIPLVIQDKTFVLAPASAHVVGATVAELGYAAPPCNTCGITPVANPLLNVCPAPCATLAGTPTGPCGRWAPEFFGPVNLVNGMVAPTLTLQPGWYRFRLANVANARTYILSWRIFGKCLKIATEAGYVNNPVVLANTLTMLPAERVELLCDLTAFKPGNYDLINSNPKPNANPGAKEILRLIIIQGVVSTEPAPVVNVADRLSTIPDLSVAPLDAQKHIVLRELLDVAQKPACPLKLVITECFEWTGGLGGPGGTGLYVGTPGTTGKPAAPNVASGIHPLWNMPYNCLAPPKDAASDYQPWNMFATEPGTLPLTCTQGTVESWIFYNPTADFHPMHFHQLHVQCINPATGLINNNELRETVPVPNLKPPANGGPWVSSMTCYVPCADAQFVLNQGRGAIPDISDGFDTNTFPSNACPGGDPAAPDDPAYRYVFHCHILEHEEWDMMARFSIVPTNKACCKSADPNVRCCSPNRDSSATCSNAP